MNTGARNLQRMAEGDKLRRLFYRHNSGNPRNSQHIAFFNAAFAYRKKGLRIHADKAVRNRYSFCLILTGDIHHHGFTGGVKVIKLFFFHNNL